MDITWYTKDPDSMFDALIELHKIININDKNEIKEIDNLILELRKDINDYCKLYCYVCNQHYYYNKYMNHANYCKK
jgi:hypothetical protein